MTVDQFREWLANAKPQDRLIYHRGEWCRRRIDMEALELQALIDHAVECESITLIQKRHAPHFYDYIAVKLEARPW